MSILTLREVAMNKSKAIKIAIAFKRGMAFVRGMQQLAKDLDQNTTVKVRTIKQKGAKNEHKNSTAYRDRL